MSYPIPLSISTFLITAVPITVTAKAVLRSFKNRLSANPERSTDLSQDVVAKASGQSPLPPNIINPKSLL
jgi:hypothetical protein